MKNRGMSEIVIRGVVCQVVGWTCQLLGLPTGNSDQALQEKQEGGKTTNQRIGRNVGKVLLCAKWVGWVGGWQVGGLAVGNGLLRLRQCQPISKKGVFFRIFISPLKYQGFIFFSIAVVS